MIVICVVLKGNEETEPQSNEIKPKTTANHQPVLHFLIAFTGLFLKLFGRYLPIQLYGRKMPDKFMRSFKETDDGWRGSPLKPGGMGRLEARRK